jgi:hypothetical protein
MNERVTINEFNVEAILAERRKVHGDFDVHAHLTQKLKIAMQSDVLVNSNYPRQLTCSQCEALEMIQHKIGRILAGNPNHIDHWDDIAGYATLVANALRKS